MTEDNKPKTLTNEEKRQLLINFTQTQKMKLLNVKKMPYRQIESIIGTYSREDVKRYLKNPENKGSQKGLRKASRFLYHNSTLYKKLVDYIGTMLTLDYFIEPYGNESVNKIDKNRFRKDYHRVVNVTEAMSIKQEYGKALHITSLDGVFYGYIHRGEDSFFLQKLDPDFCEITGIDDGCYTFAFNFAYFFSYPERIETYPIEFKRKFTQLTEQIGDKKKSSTYWLDLDPNNTECFLSNTVGMFPIPPVIQIFDSILDISEFKDIDKIDKEMDVYKLIHQKIPFGGEIDDYLLNLDKAEFYDELLSEVVPENIGKITSPMDIKEISFQRESVDKNKVAEATKQMWSDVGISHLLFAGESTSIGLEASLTADESPLFELLRQVERSINRQIKLMKSTKYKFRTVFLNITQFNKEKMQKKYMESASLGYSKLEFNAALGNSPSHVVNMTFLENEILGLNDSLIPLKSTHTASSEKGRPTEDNVGDSGAKQRDNNANNNTR